MGFRFIRLLQKNYMLLLYMQFNYRIFPLNFFYITFKNLTSIMVVPYTDLAEYLAYNFAG